MCPPRARTAGGIMSRLRATFPRASARAMYAAGAQVQAHSRGRAAAAHIVQARPRQACHDQGAGAGAPWLQEKEVQTQRSVPRQIRGQVAAQAPRMRDMIFEFILTRFICIDWAAQANVTAAVPTGCQMARDLWDVAGSCQCANL